MKAAAKPLPTWLKWVMSLFGVIFIIYSLWALAIISLALWLLANSKNGLLAKNGLLLAEGLGRFVGTLVVLLLGGWLLKRAWKKSDASATTEAVKEASVAATPVAVSSANVSSASTHRRHFSTCNILHLAPDAKRLWQFEAKGKGFVPVREHRVPHAEMLPGKLVAKSWATLLQPKLNVAWLPAESVFLRVVELPAANAAETASMVELQLEKLSPIPVTQIVWTMHVMGTHQGTAKADGTVERLQSVIVVIAARAQVEEFLGRLERDGFLADRLEAPMLDQLEAVQPKGDSVWLFPLTIGGQNSALVGWWFGGAWRNLSFVTLPPAGDRAAELKTQLALLAMSGEVEGWLTERHEWYLVADPVNAAEWEQLLRAGLNEPVQVVAPPAPVELAARSAQRAATSEAKVHLQPPEFSERYNDQFKDRLYLHAMAFVGVIYAVVLAIYFCAVGWEGYQARGAEVRVARISNNYTNAIQLKARLAVLQERSDLKFAALDCWQLVAQELPAAVTLQRSSFVGGNKLMLSGTVGAADTQKLSDFYKALRKATKDGQPFFSQEGGDQLSYRSQGPNTVYWNFSLDLLHGEAEQ